MFHVNDDDQTNTIYKPVLTSGKYRQSRRRSSSFDPPLRRQRQPTRDEYQKIRRRSSSCEPTLPLTRPNVLRSSWCNPSYTGRSQSGLNQSATFSILNSVNNENTEDTIKRVSFPQLVKDIDIDPPLKESSTTHETTSTINDDEEDSLGFLQSPTFWGIPAESEDVNETTQKISAETGEQKTSRL